MCGSFLKAKPEFHNIQTPAERLREYTLPAMYQLTTKYIRTKGFAPEQTRKLLLRQSHSTGARLFAAPRASESISTRGVPGVVAAILARRECCAQKRRHGVPGMAGAHI